MALRLITEKIESVDTVIVEAKDSGKKNYFLEGVFLQANLRNQNGRIYPLSTMIKEVNRYKINSIDRKRSLGELNHSNIPSVNPERASHMVESLVQSGNDFIGKARVLTGTPMGKIVAALIDEGAQLGVSSRGLGSLKETNEGTIVQEDYFMSAIDVVADPSAPDAFVRGIMEGKEWVWESGVLREKDVSNLANIVDAAHISTKTKSERNVVFTESFKQFLALAQKGVSLKVENTK